MQKWEYLVEYLNGIPNSEDLSSYGQDSWEMVSFIVTRMGSYVCIFKRPIGEAPQ